MTSVGRENTLRGLRAVLVVGVLCSSAGCLRFVESPWDSSTAAGIALQWIISRAPFAIGQENSYSVYGVERGFNAPSGMALFGSTIYVSDRDNKRAVRFGLPAVNHEPAQLALGQPSTSNSLQAGSTYPTGLASMDRPGGVATDGIRVAVADRQNHRVLLWLSPPVYSGQPADVVLGQPDAVTKVPTVAQDRMNSPQGVAFCNNRLYVADTGNNRILVYETIPTATGALATAVLGHANFVTSVAGAVAATSMNTPIGLHCDGTKLYAADSGYHRVLIWNTAPTATMTAADVAVGQPNLSTGGMVAASAIALNAPAGVFAVQNGAMAVADSGNNRVLYYNSILVASGVPADRVFGQSSFTTTAAAAAGTYNVGLSNPASVAIDSAGRLYAVDLNLNRIVVWKNPTASTTGATIDLVLGQPTVSETPVSHNPGAGAFRLLGPAQFAFAGNRMFAALASHSRVLGWHNAPTYREAGADFALGQPNLETVGDDNVGGATAGTLDLAGGVCSNGTHLFVGDANNHRILVWNSLPATNQVPADRVLGQANFTSSAPNGGGGVAQNTLNGPGGIYCDSQRLIVGDQSNNRVLFYNLPIVTNQQNASLVLGQGTFATNAAVGGTTGMTQPGPPPILADGKLLVLDTGNNRILIWNSLPTTNGQAADVVLGQNDFTTVAPNGGGSTSDRHLSVPQGAFFQYDRLFVGDLSNNRIMVWKGIPTSNGTAAAYVIGQSSFTANLPNAGVAVSAFTFFGPATIVHRGDTFFVGDLFNQRIVAIEDKYFVR